MLVALAGCEQTAALTSAQPASAKGDAKAAAGVEPVVAGPPVRKTLTLTTTQPARIEAFEAAPLYAKVSGYVNEVLVDIGDRVEKDQVLVLINVPELKDELRQKQALIEQAKAEVGQAQAAQKAAQASLTSAQASVEQAKAGTARAEAEYQRWRAESGRIDALAESGSVTQKVADETRNQFRSADAARQEAAAMIRSAEAAVAEANAGIEKAQADVIAAKARQTVAESELVRVQTMLAYTEIKAPFAGIVTSRNVDTGHFIPQGGGSGPLVAVMRTDRVRIFLEVPEIEAAKVDIGDPATIRVQALDAAEFTGEVTRTGWALDEENRSLTTEIDLDNAEGQFRPGMYATTIVQLAVRENVLTLPVPAIARKEDGTFCFVIRDGKAVRTPIKLGLRVGGEWEIASGLSGDATVALAKADTLKDGQSVEAVAPTP